MAGPLQWIAGAVGSGVLGNFAYDALVKKEVTVDLLDLFPSFDKTQLVPGSHHPAEGFHPDVLAALNGLAPILNGLQPTKYVEFRSLPAPDLSKDLLLLGGPISNELSLKLHGHTFSGKKISPLPNQRSGFRWHFFYPEPTFGEPAYSRYVSGQLLPKMRKAIVDTRAPSNANVFDSRCGDDGLISTDYLLITVQPNPFANGNGSTVVEVADLQGQGDKAFSRLLANDAARRELQTELRSSRHFQALYEVPVVHNSSRAETMPGIPKLRGIAPLT